MAGMAGPSSQMFQAVSQAAARPLSWTSTPYGSMAGQQYPGRGTTLNSMRRLLWLTDGSDNPILDMGLLSK